MIAFAKSVRAILFATCAIAFAPIANAAPSADSDTNERGRIALTITGAIDEAPAIADTVRELLRRLDVVIDESPRTTVLARVNVDLTSPADAVVVIESGTTGQVLERRVVRRDSSVAIVREEIAHAILSTIEAQLLSESERAHPAPPPSPVASPSNAIAPDTDRAPSATRLSSFALEASTFAGAGLFASGATPVHVGASVGVASRRGLHPSLAVAFQYGLPFEVGSSLIASHASFESARALGSIELFGSSWFALDLGAAAGFDVLAVSPRSQELPTANIAAGTTRVDPILGAFASANVALIPGVVFDLAFGGDLDLASRRYVVAEGARSSDVFVPWRVRPTLLAGFTFTGRGDPRFPRASANP